jgi:diguanylate cyclase (GGDEF)-like protein/PAS domain S-box-containing protein
MIQKFLSRQKFQQKLRLSFTAMIILMAINAAVAGIAVISISNELDDLKKIESIIKNINLVTISEQQFTRSLSKADANRVYQLLDTTRLQLLQVHVHSGADNGVAKTTSLLDDFRGNFQKYVIEKDQTAALESRAISTGRSLVATMDEIRSSGKSKLFTSGELNYIISQVLAIQWQGQELQASKSAPSPEHLRNIVKGLVTYGEQVRFKPRDIEAQKIFFQIVRDVRDFVSTYERQLQYQTLTNKTEMDLSAISERIRTSCVTLESQVRQSIRGRIMTAGSLMLLIFISSFATARFMALFLSRHITRPVSELVDITRRIAGGERNARGTVVVDDEIGELTECFNKMTDDLQRSENELISHNLQLEQTVAERTAHLTMSEEKHRILFRDSPDAYLVIKNGVFTDCNRAAEIMLQGDRTQIIGQSPDVLSPEYQPDGRKSAVAAEEKIAHALRTGTNFFEWLHRRFDGSCFHVEVSLATMTLDGKAALFVSWRDITGRKETEEALRVSEARYARVIRGTSDGFWDWNIRTGENYYSPRYKELLGYDDTEYDKTAHAFEAIIHPDDVPMVQSAQRAHLENHKPYDIELRLRCKNDEYRWFRSRGQAEWDADGSTRNMAGSITDITDRKRAEAALAVTHRELEALSITDGLTGIANRRHFDEVLAREYARHARSGAELSLILLDIDHFKAFNDLYGHLKGDECLRLTGGVLAAHTQRPADLAARYGGEEFACILPETNRAGALLIAENIRQAIIELAISHKGSNVADVVTASLGVVSTRCATDGVAADVVAMADTLLYQAKSQGRNRVAC